MARIVLDGLPLQVRSAGVAVYTRALVRAMAALRPQDEFILFGPPRRQTEAAEWPRNVGWYRSLRYPLVMGVPSPAPRALDLESILAADLFHATAYTAPRSQRVPVIVSVHDLALLRFPELGSADLRGVPQRTARACDEARLVLASSQATRRDLIELLAVPDARIRVVHLGCDAALRPLPQEVAAARVRQRFDLAAPYILHVGTLEPRKNQVRLLHAYARLRSRLPGVPPLVLAGERGWQYEAIFAAVDELGLRDSVRFTGRFPTVELAALCSAAAVFVFPSLYEGFGLPPLEAMACGTPVVCADTSSLPEVVGDAALLVDPHDIEAIAAALQRLLEDPALCQQLRERGLARAREFTWERCARATLAAYDELL